MFGLFELTIEQEKEFLKQKLKPGEFKITIDSDKCFAVEIPVKQRSIELKLNSYKKGSIVVDIIDPFGMIRIPRKTFHKKESIEIFLMDSLRTILINSKLT